MAAAAELTKFALPTLSALVSASVFSTTFLSSRVHRERARALDRALQIDERISAGPGEAAPLSPRVLDEQRRVLAGTLADVLAWVVLAMNGVIAAAVIVLAASFASDAGLLRWSGANRPGGRALLALAGTELLVVAVGAADTWFVRRNLRHRLRETAMGQLASAERTLRRNARRRRTRDDELLRAHATAWGAVRASGGHLALAWAVLGYVELALHRANVSALTSELAFPARNAEKHLRRAIELGPATGSMWMAWAAAAEESLQPNSTEAAAAGWLEGLRLELDEYLRGPEERLAGGDDESGPPVLFQPQQQLTMMEALDRIPPSDDRASLILLAFCRVGPDHSGYASSQASTILDAELADGNWIGARTDARAFARTQVPSVREVAAAYLAADGPIAAAREQWSRELPGRAATK